MWNKPISINDTTDAILLDTEGLGSTERSTNTDSKIFSIAILLSSLFIYNQIGAIDEQAIEDLSLVCNLTENIHIDETSIETGLEFKSFFPSFLWVLRDFHLDLEGMSPREYLEKCLQLSPGMTEEIYQKNMIRESITKFFINRDCMTMIRPVTNESDLAHIEDLDESLIREGFEVLVQDFVKRVYSGAKPKIVNSKSVNGPMLRGLAMDYVNSINERAIPTVMTALDRVVSEESRRIINTIMFEVKQTIEETLPDDQLLIREQGEPVSVEKTFMKIREDSMEILHRELSQILSVDEVISHYNKFTSWLDELEQDRHRE